jgi:hypothetical protein
MSVFTWRHTASKYHGGVAGPWPVLDYGTTGLGKGADSIPSILSAPRPQVPCRPRKTATGISISRSVSHTVPGKMVTRSPVGQTRRLKRD